MGWRAHNQYIYVTGFPSIYEVENLINLLAMSAMIMIMYLLPLPSYLIWVLLQQSSETQSTGVRHGTLIGLTSIVSITSTFIYRFDMAVCWLLWMFGNVYFCTCVVCIIHVVHCGIIRLHIRFLRLVDYLVITMDNGWVN